MPADTTVVNPRALPIHSYIQRAGIMRVRFQKISIGHAAVFMLIALSIGGLSCEQYDYTSPLPGRLEVRLASKNSRTTLMPFSPTNTLPLRLRKVVARQSNGVTLELLADVNAIKRNADGDIINALDTLSRDSTTVLGVANAAPGTYTGVDIEVDLPLSGVGFVNVITGFVPNTIQIFNPPGIISQTIFRFPTESGQLNYEVNEGRKTILTITFDMDSSLVRRTEWFEYHPYFYLSSIQNL